MIFARLVSEMTNMIDVSLTLEQLTVLIRLMRLANKSGELLETLQMKHKQLETKRAMAALFGKRSQL